MYQMRHRSLMGGLCVLLFFAVSACSDAAGGAGTVNSGPGGESELQLSGELVPTGGVSMNETFILSGSLSSGTPELTSANESFSLKVKPVQNVPVQ